MQELSTVNEGGADSQLVGELAKQGWRASTISAIEPEIQAQFEWQDQPDAECWLGPMWLYIMPQSKAHEGAQSIYALAQFCYVPSLNTWAILQHFHMSPQPWSQHRRVLEERQPGFQAPRSPWWRRGSDQLEQAVMAQCVQLPGEFQVLSPTDVIQRLLYNGAPWAVPDDVVGQPISARLEQALKAIPMHTEHILRAMKLVASYVPVDGSLWRQWLDQAMSKTVAGLLHGQPFSNQDMLKWLDNLETVLRQDATQPRRLKHQHFQLSMAATPFLAQPMSSALECVMFSWIGGTQNAMKNMLNGEYWQLGRGDGKCRECKRTHTKDGQRLLLGPCNVCQGCEDMFNGVASTSQPERPQPVSSRTESTRGNDSVGASESSIGLSRFVNLLLG